MLQGGRHGGGGLEFEAKQRPRGRLYEELIYCKRFFQANKTTQNWVVLAFAVFVQPL